MDIVEPLVSVSCITYNHALYIRQCLDGFVMQKTTFPFEVLIHDDASTDGTIDIIKEYEKKYPHIIKPIYENENQWMKGRKGTRVFNYPRAKGKYIAFCEGDDYWTDPLKLQKQVDFLEAHPNYGLVHGYAKSYNEKNKSFDDKLIGSDFKDADQIIIANKVITLSACARMDLYGLYLKEIASNPSWKMSDYPLWIYIALKSKVYFLNEVVGVYRVLENSASHSNDIEKEIDFLYNAYSVSNFFAINNGKRYLLYDIKKNLLYSVLHTYVVKNHKADKKLWHIIKDLKVFTFKGTLLLTLVCSKYGRNYLRNRWS